MGNKRYADFDDITPKRQRFGIDYYDIYNIRTPKEIFNNNRFKLLINESTSNDNQLIKIIPSFGLCLETVSMFIRKDIKLSKPRSKLSDLLPIIYYQSLIMFIRYIYVVHSTNPNLITSSFLKTVKEYKLDEAIVHPSLLPWLEGLGIYDINKNDRILPILPDDFVNDDANTIEGLFSFTHWGHFPNFKHMIFLMAHTRRNDPHTVLKPISNVLTGNNDSNSLVNSILNRNLIPGLRFLTYNNNDPILQEIAFNLLNKDKTFKSNNILNELTFLDPELIEYCFEITKILDDTFPFKRYNPMSSLKGSFLMEHSLTILSNDPINKPWKPKLHEIEIDNYITTISSSRFLKRERFVKAKNKINNDELIDLVTTPIIVNYEEGSYPSRYILNNNNKVIKIETDIPINDDYYNEGVTHISFPIKEEEVTI